MRFLSSVVSIGILATAADGFLVTKQSSIQNIRIPTSHHFAGVVRCTKPLSSKPDVEDLDETTKKYGLEAGLYKAVTAKPEDGQTVKPQDLLKKYGTAYLATSITLALISYALCYLLVSSGVDVASLLEKVGIQSTAAAANTGTAAIAYAVHKAASPIRFPPTVALTPVVAGWLGKKPAEDEKK